MTTTDPYQRLADMFDQLPPGVSYTPSIMEVFRLQYTPEEADLAATVGLKGIKLDEVQRRTGFDREKLKRMLNTMADKGTMWITPGEENPNYRAVGMGGPGLIETGGWLGVKFPFSVQLLKAMHKFQREWATRAAPAIGFPTSHVWAAPAALPEDAQPSENVAERIKEAGFWSVSDCSCRLPHWVADPGNHCSHLLETCLILGKMGRWCVEHGMAREITYDEALDLLRRCNEDGLVHNYDPNWAICNCCADCCVFLVGYRETGADVLGPSPFLARADEEACSACSVCADRCPVDAIEVEESAVVDESRCLGCGVCVTSCDTGAMRLVRRPAAVTAQA